MLFRILFLSIFSASLLFGVSKEAQEIHKHYKSLAKDFLIYQFLKKESTSKEDALFLIDDTKRLTPRLKKLFAKKIGDKYYFGRKFCASLSKEEFEKKCISTGMSPRKFQKLSLKKQKKFYKKVIKKHSTKKTSWMSHMIANNTFGSLMKKDDGSDFIKIFNGVSSKYKQKVLDKKFSGTFLTKFANNKKFRRFVTHVALTLGYKNLPQSLTKIDPKREILHHDSAFYIGVIATQKGYTKKARLFFQRAQKEAKYKNERDKALFWEYLVSNKKAVLEQVASSEDLNFYSAYAREILHKPAHELLTPAPTKEKIENYSITDPFTWAYTRDYLKDLNKTKLAEFAQKFYTKETLGHYAYIMERAGGYTKNYFIMPYREYLKGVDIKRQVLIYSLARQESRFIPASVSTSYALGMMQFMPFLIDATAKDEELKEFKYFDILEPKNALNFANIHLDYLESFLYSPLFIAYAYNGGIGFTKRMLTKQKLFQKGKYEPFLSMELVPYTESRKYGKKVLANYVSYARLNGLNITFKNLLQILTQPQKSDRFRN